MSQYKKYFFLLFLSAIIISGCEKEWDKRTDVADQNLNIDLLGQIQSEGNLSTFASYLAKTGYDKVLASSKTFTVWAPTNESLQNIDPALVADTALLRKFVENHIANSTFFTYDAANPTRVSVMNGKFLSVTESSVNDVSVITPNNFVKNGVLHIVNAPLHVRLNIDEYIRSLTTNAALQKAYILSQDTTYTDTALATTIGFDQVTRKPILEPGTGIVKLNRYYRRTRDLTREDSTFTYFLLTDDAYQTEHSKLTPYFKTVTNNADSTNKLAAFHLLKDVIVSGNAAAGSTVVSIDGVPVPFNSAAIVSSYKASNGTVYVLNSASFNVAHKIKPVIIQGESPTFFSRTDYGSSIRYRSRRISSTGEIFRDIHMGGTTALPPSSFAAYTINGLYTTKYRVIRRAYNDVYQITSGTTVTGLSNKVYFGEAKSVAPSSTGTQTPAGVLIDFGFKNILLFDANELLLTGATRVGTPTATNKIDLADGTLKVVNYGSVNMYVQGPNLTPSSTTVNNNAVVLDYVRLEPILY